MLGKTRQIDAKELQKTYEDNATFPWWCKGCGDFAVLDRLPKALAKCGVHPEDLLIVTGIGCSSKIGGYLNGNWFNGVHGRALPTALGAKMANPDLTVVVLGGDGDGFAIGTGHFPHAARRNIGFTYIVMDNEIYGLTKGQTSPTSKLGHVTKTTPDGNAEAPMNPLALALSQNASFIARAFSGKPQQLEDIMVQALQHKGFSYVDVLSPCVTYFNTYPEYRQLVYDIDKDYAQFRQLAIPDDLKSLPLPPAYDSSKKFLAFFATQPHAKVPLGVLYREERPTLEASRHHADNIVKQDLDGVDYSPALKRFLA